MTVKEHGSIIDSMHTMRSYALNDNRMDYKIILSLVFGKNKLATKKRARIEGNYLSDLSKDSISLPNAFGDAPTVALYTLKNVDASSLGVDHVGSDNLIKDIQNNVISPNYLITFKEDMPSLTKYSRVLGPKGLMPTPKQGTIVDEDNIKSMVGNLKKGSFKIKLNKLLTAHIPIGTLSMDDDKIYENASVVLSFVEKHLPSSFIKSNLNNIYMNTTQGPSCTLSIK